MIRTLFRALACIAVVAMCARAGDDRPKRKPRGSPVASELLRTAQVELAEGRYAEAVRDLTAAVEAKGPDAELYRLRAGAYAKMANWPRAASDWDRVVADLRAAGEKL